MANSTRNKAHFKNLVVKGSVVDLGNPASGYSASAATAGSRVILPRVEHVTFASHTLTITDAGAGGGYGSIELFTLPSSRIVVLGSYLNFQVLSVAAGIIATATVNVGLGTTATTNATIDSTEIAFVSVAGSAALVGGAGTIECTNPPILTLFDAVTPTKAYLNVGVVDASISANSSMVINATARIAYLDLSLGA